jgi:hypothetical protein
MKSDFVKRLAAEMEQPKVTTITEDKESLTSEQLALDHAKAYWMLGWAWEEIDAILSDMEFPKSIIDEAIKEAQQYAHEQLKNGPFTSLKNGQKVCLKNGEDYQLVQVTNKFATVEGASGKIKVTHDQIDFAKSALLLKAYNLRISAEKMFIEADETTALDIAPEKAMEPIQEKEFKDRTTTQMQTPREWVPFLDKNINNIKELEKPAQDAVQYLKALHEEKNKIDAELDAAKKAFKDQIKKRESESVSLKKEQIETAKSISSILGAEENASGILESVVFRKFEDVLVGFVQYIKQEPMMPIPTDEFQKLISLVQTRAPEVFSDIMIELDKWREANTLIKEKLMSEVALINQEKVKRKMSQSVWSDLKGFFSNIWTSIRDSLSKVTSTIVPKTESMTKDLEQFMMSNDVETVKEAVKKALRVRLG